MLVRRVYFFFVISTVIISVVTLVGVWLAIANPFFASRSDVELVSVIKSGNHVILGDSKNHVATWNLQMDRYDWITLPNQMGFGAPSQFDASFYALTRSRRTSSSYSNSSYLHYFDGTTVKELCEWPQDGRMDELVVVGPNHICGFRGLGYFPNAENEAFNVCEFYKTDANSIRFDHQFLVDSRHSSSDVCSVSPTKILIYQVPTHGGFSQFVSYDFQERRVLSIGQSEFQGRGQLALDSTADGKFVIAFDGHKISLIDAATCTTKTSHDTEHNLAGLLTVAISDDHRFAVVASIRLLLLDLTTNESQILDELNSSEIESKTPLLKAPRGLPDTMGEAGARLAMCAAGVAFVPSTNKFVVWMHSGEVQYWDAEKREKTKTTQMNFEL